MTTTHPSPAGVRRFRRAATIRKGQEGANNLVAGYRSLLSQGFPAEWIRIGGLSSSGPLAAALLLSPRRD